MIYTEDDPETLILSRLVRYADHCRDFNRNYVDDVYDFFHDSGYITVNQLHVLSKIYSEIDYDRFFSDEEDE